MFNRKLKQRVQYLEEQYERMKSIQDLQNKLLEKLAETDKNIISVLGIAKVAQTPKETIEAFTQ